MEDERQMLAECAGPKVFLQRFFTWEASKQMLCICSYVDMVANLKQSQCWREKMPCE